MANGLRRVRLDKSKWRVGKSPKILNHSLQYFDGKTTSTVPFTGCIFAVFDVFVFNCCCFLLYSESSHLYLFVLVFSARPYFSFFLFLRLYKSRIVAALCLALWLSEYKFGRATSGATVHEADLGIFHTSKTLQLTWICRSIWDTWYVYRLRLLIYILDIYRLSSQNSIR